MSNVPMAALTSSFAFNAIQLSVMSQKFVTYSAVIPGKPAIAGATRNPGNSKKLDSRFRGNDS